VKDILKYLFAFRSYFWTVLVAVFLLSSCPVYADAVCPGCEEAKKGVNVDMDTIQSFLDRAEECKKEIKTPQISSQAKEEAEKVYKTYQSKEFQAGIKKYEEELKNNLFKNNIDPYRKYYSGLNKNIKNYLMPDEKIYIFISSSIPMYTLRNYAVELDRLRDPNIVMVMRGFVNGMKYFKPTLEFLKKLLVKNPSQDFRRGNVMWANVEIDPRLFRKYGIKRVPAIAYVKGDGNAYVIYGDVSLKYAVEKFKEETRSSSLKLIFDAL